VKEGKDEAECITLGFVFGKDYFWDSSAYRLRITEQFVILSKMFESLMCYFTKCEESL
jgi:hypothetical protein